MKIVVFKAVVPDDEIDNLTLTDSSGTLPFSIIHRPTNEEIDYAARKHIGDGFGKNIFGIGVRWLCDKIFGEE